MEIDDGTEGGPHFGPFRSVRAKVVAWLMTHTEAQQRAIQAHVMCLQAEMNLKAYRKVRNAAIRQWHTEDNVKPAHIAARLQLGKSSVHNILNDDGDA